MSKLDGKTAVITGGSSGIGFAIAKLFVEEGATVFITGRRQSELDAAVKEIGRNVTAVQGDVAKLEDLDRLYKEVEKKGRIDVLVANAGVADSALLSEMTPEHFDKVFNVNVRGAVFTVNKALKLLNDGSSIIIMGSVAGVKGNPGFSAYGASKAAVRNLVRVWTTELSERKIRSNVISPGPIDTDLLAALPGSTRDLIVNSIPMKRMGRADEVAKTALFLASDDSSFMSGTEVFVDGGRAQV